jgi:hypothetical protein
VKALLRLTVLLGVCAAVFAEETAPELVARYEKLSVGAPVTISGLTINNSSMKLTLLSGAAAPVKAGGEVIGLFFKGEGFFDYAVNDAVELPILQTNLKNLKTKGPVNGVLHVDFTDALIATQNIALPKLEGAAAPALDDAFAKNRAVFLNGLESRLSIGFAAHKLIAGNQRLMRAELRGDGEWTYNADHENERLAQLYTIDLENRARRIERYEGVISDRPVGRTRLDPPPFNVMLTNLDYSIVASDGRDVSVTATETLMPRIDGVRGFVFSLITQWWADGPKPPRQYLLKSVTAEDGKGVPFYQDHDVVIVSLPHPTQAASPIKLKFEMAGDILVREGGDNQWLLREGWFPELPLNAMLTTAHGLIKVKAPFVPFAGGHSVARKTEGDYNVLEVQLDQPTQFVAVTAGKYSYEEEKRGRITVRTASYGQKNTRAIKKINGLAFDMIAYYEYFLGPYPHDELNIVEVNDYGWGQAPAGLIFITGEAFQPLIGLASQLFSEGINERIAHEIAHQYWGHVVRMPSFEEQWLTESFAEYSAALLLKKFQGDAPYNRLVAHWKADAKESHALAPIPLANRIVTPNNDDANRVKLLYGKGPLLLAALDKQVGSDTFMIFLKSYQKTFHHKAGTTKDVAGLLGFIAKQDFKPFFDKYYWGTDVPEVK